MNHVNLRDFLKILNFQKNDQAAKRDGLLITGLGF